MTARMAGLLYRIARTLFGSPRVSESPEPHASSPRVPSSHTPSFDRVDSNAETRDWFDGRIRPQLRDSIVSDPDAARWFKKPRFVVDGAASHRTSDVSGGR